MIKVFVDSSCSIKKEERACYGVEILPLKIMLGDEEYLDGENLSTEEFFARLTDEKVVPKTSLPSLDDAQQRISRCLEEGYDVLVLTLSSGISGTYSALKMLFAENEKVRVVDSKTSVGGLRILVEEANKYLDRSLDFVEEKLNELIPKIRIMAVPETLTYLYKGGRLSAVRYALGTALHIKPIIELSDTVNVVAKTIGLKMAMRTIVSALKNCDPNYPIVPSYTYDDSNLKTLISMTGEEYKAQMTEYDHILPAIAAHWGPNAFGYIFVAKE